MKLKSSKSRTIKEFLTVFYGDEDCNFLMLKSTRIAYLDFLRDDIKVGTVECQTEFRGLVVEVIVQLFFEISSTKLC